MLLLALTAPMLATKTSSGTGPLKALSGVVENGKGPVAETASDSVSVSLCPVCVREVTACDDPAITLESVTLRLSLVYQTSAGRL